MPKLNIKLPFLEESKTRRRNRIIKDTDNQTLKTTSKERVRKYRERLKSDPSLKGKLELNKIKKALENAAYIVQGKNKKKETTE